MSLMDKARYRLGRWRALGGAYRSEFEVEVSRAIQKTPGSMTQGPNPGARYDDSHEPQDHESGTEI